MVGRIDLERIVTTAVELPDVFVRQVVDHRFGFRVLAEEVLTGVGTAVSLVVLVLTVDRFIHAFLQDAFLVLLEQRVPVTSPDDLDDVPTGTTEHAFELVHHAGVTAHRTVQALQVAVDDEDQVIEVFTSRQGNRAQGFRLITLAVAHKAPDLTVVHVFQLTVMQVLHHVGLIDGLNRAKTHRHRGELPVVRHQPRVRVGREAIAVDFATEFVHLLF